VAKEVFERERRLEAKKRNWDTDGSSPVLEQWGGGGGEREGGWVGFLGKIFFFFLMGKS